MDDNKPQQQEDEINLLDYVIVILKHKEFIIKTTLAAMLIAAVISFIIPPTYLAVTKMLPPQSGNSSTASLMATQMAGLGISPASLGLKSPNDLYVSLLGTKPVMDYVIDQCDLMREYKVYSREDMRETLSRSLVVDNDKKSGIISVGFVHHKPQKAADIANAYVEGLQNLNNNLAVTEASQRRLFFEGQLKNAKESLIKSEEALKSFSQRTGSIKIDEEAKAAIETVAEMRAKISGKEVQLRVMKGYATSENQDLKNLQEEISALKGELAKLESRTRAPDNDNSVATVGRISSLGTEYLRRTREFKYNEALYEILIKQFEASKLDESKDAALIQIVEKAEAPERRFKPSRKKILFGTGVFFLMSSIVFVFAREYYNRFTSSASVNETFLQLAKYMDFTQLCRDLKLDVLCNFLKKVFVRK